MNTQALLPGKEHTHVLRHGNSYACTEAWKLNTYACTETWKYKNTQVLRPGMMHTQALRPGTKGQPLKCDLHVVHKDHPWYKPNNPKVTKMVLINRSTWFCIKSCPQYFAVCMWIDSCRNLRQKTPFLDHTPPICNLARDQFL